MKVKSKNFKKSNHFRLDQRVRTRISDENASQQFTFWISEILNIMYDLLELCRPSVVLRVLNKLIIHSLFDLFFRTLYKEF
jgi:hypothetical protein